MVDVSKHVVCMPCQWYEM